jgi:hypothetical protein
VAIGETHARYLYHINNLLSTSQIGVAKRLMPREVSQEFIHSPGSLPETISALSQMDVTAF